MAHDNRAALLAAAMASAERGWPVFPLRPGDKRPAGHAEADCPGTGRCSAGHLKWEQRATTDPDLIRAAWTARPYNIGIATGPAGLLVIDLDKPKNQNDMPDGMTTFKALCERAGQAIPTTHRIRTASGGQHLYFANPVGVHLRSTAGKLGRLIDTRAHGGYVVSAGSMAQGGAYEVIDPAPVVPLPHWLIDALMPRCKKARPVPAALTTGANRYATAALRNEKANVATAPEGTRNATLLRAARALGRLVATGDLNRSVVEDALSGAALAGGSESPRYYADVITRALNWSIANNPSKGHTA
ncbi:bifunctional DNA primase/polymerase [Streptomyces sp. NBC_01803]|uniref:bifunctional DNA primase/polymerase n=1 Tax=Streptomyces sp. NBC_01803 TaxID=2975946 RepID=UPI002DD8E3AB|nr:bifunctional DNA primase/polymerase [Streptomyces sp. NBC_01803]WSA45305.1 bifunctional DNA primase/polymerase [Streptomyces sp. NBC_01803]